MERHQTDLLRALGRIEGKLDSFLPRVESLELRMRSIENWRWYVLGMFAAVVFLAGWIFNS